MAGVELEAPGIPEGPVQNEAGETQIRRLIALLEFEIGRIRSEESGSGWTTWALLGALATAAWLLTLEVEATAINATSVLCVLLVLNLAYDSFLGLVPLLLGPRPVPKSARLQLSYNVFSSSRRLLLFEAARCIGMIAIGAVGSAALGTIATISTLLFYAGWLLFVFCGLLLSYLKWPVLKDASPSSAAYCMFGALLALGAVALVGTLPSVWRYGAVSMTNEYRVGGLLFTILMVSRLLSRGRPRTPLLGALVDIRQSLGLGKMDIQSARRQTEIALAGMTVTDVLQEEIAELLSHLEQTSTELDSAASELEGASSTVVEEGTEISEAEGTVLRAVMRSIVDHIKNADAALAEYDDGYERLWRRFLVLQKIVPASGHDELVRLHEKLGEAGKDAERKCARLGDELERFGALVQSTEGPGADQVTADDELTSGLRSNTDGR
jgi:hypothetical protein